MGQADDIRHCDTCGATLSPTEGRLIGDRLLCQACMPSTMKCPVCGLISPISTARCDCGYDFLSGRGWKVNFATFLGGFQVKGKRSIQLLKPGILSLSDKGILQLSGRFDPPGSGWMALLATIITAIVFAFMALARGYTPGFYAGPGWLIWYLIIVLIRREKVSIPLQNSESVVLDPSSRRMGFRTNFTAKDCWVVFEIKDGFEEASKCVRTLLSSRCSNGKIGYKSRLPLIIILAIMATALGLLAWLIISNWR